MPSSIVTHIGPAHVFGIPATFVAYNATPAGDAVSGYVMPNITDADIKHVASKEMTHAKTGGISGLTVSAEYLECTFSLIPEAVFTTDSATTLAKAITSGHIFAAGTTFAITGMPVFIIGPFSDAFNTGGAGILANRWIYTDGGSSKQTSTGKTIFTITLQRFPDITGTAGTVITA
jgi:hypothetical protein